MIAALGLDPEAWTVVAGYAIPNRWIAGHLPDGVRLLDGRTITGTVAA